MDHPEIVENVLENKMSKDELLAQFDKLFSNDYDKIDFVKSVFLVIYDAKNYRKKYGNEDTFTDMTEDQIENWFLRDAVDTRFNFDEDLDLFNLILSVCTSAYETVYTGIDKNTKT